MVSSETNPKLVRKVTASTKVYTRLDKKQLGNSFSIAENRYDKQNFTAEASNLVKNTERSNFEKVVS